MRREWHGQLLAEQQLPDAELRAQRVGPHPGLPPPREFLAAVLPFLAAHATR